MVQSRRIKLCCSSDSISHVLPDEDQKNILNQALKYDNTSSSSNIGLDRFKARKSIVSDLNKLIKRKDGEHLVRDVLEKLTIDGIKSLKQIVGRSSSNLLTIMDEILNGETFVKMPEHIRLCLDFSYELLDELPDEDQKNILRMACRHDDTPASSDKGQNKKKLRQATALGLSKLIKKKNGKALVRDVLKELTIDGIDSLIQFVDNQSPALLGMMNEEIKGDNFKWLKQS